MWTALRAWVLVGVLCGLAYADGPADNIATAVRPVPPPPRQPLSAADRARIESMVASLGKEIETLRQELAGRPDLAALLLDVQIYLNAIRYPLVYDEQIDVKTAQKALEAARARIAQLKAGHPQWVKETGPRGYISKIDGSVQPYLLYVPDSYAGDPRTPRRLDFFCHGRDEGLTELKFISSSAKSTGERFYVTLYGRYCCANKFAGEIDCLEALADLEKRYPIDPNRVVMTGFSMGGAACWQFAVHYSDLWCAASPGAGFSETADFLKVFQKEVVQPAGYEQKLWHLYDCTDYAVNLFNVPTVAYAGEIDSQKQASDMMLAAMEKEGLRLERIIGPKTGHKYELGAKKILDARLDELAARGRNSVPRQVRFTTWTLRYNRMFWLTVDGLEKHWERARLEAEATGPSSMTITTSNVSALSISYPFAAGPAPTIRIDGTALTGTHFARTNGAWHAVKEVAEGLHKRHGLQGPIDDAFLDAFIIVKPSGKPLNDQVGAWTASECQHAIDHWRKQFRGEARVKLDTELNAEDIASANLVLFGDPSSNRLLAKLVDRLPIQWDAQAVKVGGRSFPAATHVPVMIYPNPLNPKRYLVLNSGFTFREYDYLNNARQVPKLPDFAVIDTTMPVNSRWPGKIVLADFFTEAWELPAHPGEGN